MNYLSKLFLSLAFVICLCAIPVQAAGKKPVVPKKLEVNIGAKEQFPIEANGWTITNAKVSTYDHSIASVLVTRNNTIDVEGRASGKIKLKINLRVTKGKKTKTFKYKTTINVIGSSVIPYDMIAYANSHESIFETHSSCEYTVTPCNDIAMKDASFYHISHYCTADEAYIENCMYDENAINQQQSNFKYSNSEREFIVIGDNTPYFTTYYMSAEDREALREKYYESPLQESPMLFMRCKSEYTKKQEILEGELLVTTYCDVDYNKTYNSNQLIKVYHLDPESYEIHSIDFYYHTNDIDYLYAIMNVKYDSPRSFEMGSLLYFVDKVMNSAIDHPQTLTIVYSDTEFYSNTIDKDVNEMYFIREGYDLFYDKEGTKPFSGPSAEDNLTLYAIAQSN